MCEDLYICVYIIMECRSEIPNSHSFNLREKTQRVSRRSQSLLPVSERFVADKERLFLVGGYRGDDRQMPRNRVSVFSRRARFPFKHG